MVPNGKSQDVPREVKKVFLVDDEPLVLKALTRVLIQEGYQVLSFAGAEAALAALEKEKPDCIISDYYMPHVDGLTFLKQVKENHPRIARVLLTGGHLDTRLNASLKEDTIQILIRKPWRMEAIRDLMEHVRLGHSGVFVKQWEGESSPVAAPPANVPAPPSRVLVGEPPSVLVVDDDPVFLQLMSVWLARLGFAVQTSPSAEEGMEQMRQINPQVLLIDLIMPGLNGIQMIRAVRDLVPQLPVVAVTGMSDRNLAIEAFRAGATCFLYKPLELEALEITLRRCLDLGHLFRDAAAKPELEAVLEVEHAIVAGIGVPRLLDLLLQVMIRYTKAEAASVLLVEPDGNTMSVAASYGLDDRVVREQRVSVGERISGWVVQHNEPQIVLGSAGEDPRQAGVVRIRTPEVGMCLPMRGRGRVVGALCVNRFQGQQLFSRDAVDLGMLLACEVGRAVEQALATEEKMDLERGVMQRDKLVTIGELASGVAHEINNPLGYVNSNLSSLSEYMDDVLALLHRLVPESGVADVDGLLEAVGKMDLQFILDDIPVCLQETKEGIKRVLKIVMDLKNFTREDLDTKEVSDINQILDGAVSIVWNQIKYKAELKREYSAIPAFPCYPSQMGQVFLNLLYNSAQAIERDGIIVLRSKCEGGKVCVELEDNGHGMAPDVVEKIFEPFFTTKPRGVGTGLGLKIAKKIIERHGGTITVKSSKGVGSTFRVEIPIPLGTPVTTPGEK